MPLSMEVGLYHGHILLDGHRASPQKGHSPQFLPHVRYGQTAGWIKMPLGMEAGLGPGDFVLDGKPAPSQRNGAQPQFSVHVKMDQDATW